MISCLKRSNQILCFSIPLIIASSCTERKEQGYYTDGRLKYEVTVENGMRDGKLIEYSEGGKIIGYSFWDHGKLDGHSVVFYPNGKTKQDNQFKSGVYCCQSRFYREDGSLQEIQYFDDRGRLADYKKFNRDGSQNKDPQSKVPIFIPERDTVMLGEYYQTQIRLGNRTYNDFKVILGDTDDKYLLKNPKLPMENDSTAIIRLRADSLGTRKIEGVILEFNPESADSILLIPFEHNFFVKSSQGDTIARESRLMHQRPRLHLSS